MKLKLLMNSDTLICLWLLVFPIGIIEVSTSRKCCFWLYFSSLQDYWPPSTWNLLVHTSWGETERREKRAFQLLKLRKMKIRWNIKTKCVTDFLLTVSSSSMRDYTCHYWCALKRQTFTLISKKIYVNFEIICLQVTRYSNTKESFPSCMFVVMVSWNCEPHTYFTFLQRILTSTHTQIFNIFCIIYMSRCPTFTFQVAIMSKSLA